MPSSCRSREHLGDVFCAKGGHIGEVRTNPERGPLLWYRIDTLHSALMNDAKKRTCRRAPRLDEIRAVFPPAMATPGHDLTLILGCSRCGEHVFADIAALQTGFCHGDENTDRANVAAYTRHAKGDTKGATEPALAGRMAKYARAVDPEGTLDPAELLRSPHEMTQGQTPSRMPRKVAV